MISADFSSHVICWIYLLRNTQNKKVYVGQTWRPLKRRFSTYNKSQPHLFNALNKHGRENFYYEVLISANTQEIANYWEDFFITKYNSMNRKFGYNKRAVAGTNGKCSEETKRKISKANLGKLGPKHSEGLIQQFSIEKMGDKNPASKITNEIARAIFISYHSDISTSCDSLSAIYGLNRSNINEIVRGKAWITATKDLLILREKTNGQNLTRSKLTVEKVIEIKQKLTTDLYTFVQLGKEYNVSDATISNISKNKVWKHVKI